MKRFLLAAAFGTVAALPALAADLPVKTDARSGPPIVSAYNWSGLYIGGHAGYGWGKSTFTGVGLLPPTLASHDISGFVGGGHAGINWQVNGSFVLGIEGAVSAAPMDGSSICPDPDFRCHTDYDHFWRAGGRIGVTNLGLLNSNWLLYGMGGFARAKLKTYFTPVAGGAETAPDTVHHHGWYAGGGLEYALLPNFIVGVEAYHVSLDEKNHFQSGGAIVSGSTRTVETDFSVVQARLSYKFNWAGTVVARY